MKKKTTTILIIISTLILAVVSIFIVSRIRSLGTRPVAPSVPESIPRAVEEVTLPANPTNSACKITFNVPTPAPGQINCSDFILSKTVANPNETIGIDFEVNGAGYRSLYVNKESVGFRTSPDARDWIKTISTGNHFDYKVPNSVGKYLVSVDIYYPNCNPKKICLPGNDTWSVALCPLDDYSGSDINGISNPTTDDDLCINSCSAYLQVVAAPVPSNSPTPTIEPTNTPTPGPTSTPVPGATNTPTPKPTNTPTPGPDPTNTPAPGPSNTPTPGPTTYTAQQPVPTDVQLPEAGIKLPALAGMILGFLLISLGVVFIF